MSAISRLTITTVASAILLAACEISIPLAPTQPLELPGPRPAQTDIVAAPRAVERSQLSRELEDFFRIRQSQFLAQGRLRSVKAPADAPYGTAQLVENFIRIGLFNEYQPTSSGPEQRDAPGPVQRWPSAIRLSVEFGGSVGDDKRSKDRAAILAYTERLSRVINRSVNVVEADANFRVLIMHEDERRALSNRLPSLMPGISDREISAIINLPRSIYCLAIATEDGRGNYNRAIAIIRAELPDLMRLSCIHEEIAQGLGLANDSPLARPSIFNDDEEFALLTQHDEDLLRILYDPRIQPGMAAAQARPIAQRIAEELLSDR